MPVKVTLMDWEAEEAEKGDFVISWSKRYLSNRRLSRMRFGVARFEMGTAILSGLDLSQRDAALINRVGGGLWHVYACGHGGRICF